MRRRGRSLTKAAAFVSLVAVALVLELAPGSNGPRDPRPPPATVAATGARSASAPASTPSEPSEPSQFAVPPSGEFRVVPGTSVAVGAGPLTTYRVELETSLTLDGAAVATVVDATLADARSWAATGEVALQRTDGDADVVIRLATPPTVDRLCRPLRTNGVFSCHQAGAVNLNVVRWQQGAEGWDLPLAEYRAYMVNHELGHALGHGHAGCPGAGQPAPVMMQQTKGLDGCVPNAWPYP